MYDVIVYGAVGDGSTDDTTAIQAAIDAANGAGGGTAFFPKGVYLVTGLTLYRKVNLQGEGRNSVIKRKPGVNADVVKSYRFANLDTPIDSFYVADLSIDGNYGQFGADAFGSGIGGSGLLINGNGWVLRNVTIRNCKDFGWRNVDLPSGSSPPSGDDPGAWQIYASDFTIWNCYGTSHLQWEGPSDCHFVNFWVYNRDYTNRANNVGMNLASGGHNISNGHIWGEALAKGLYIGGGNTVITGMTVESMNTNGTCVHINAIGTAFYGYIYDNTADHTTKNGIQVGGPGQAEDCIIDAIVSNCYAAGVRWVNATNGCIVRIHATAASNTATALVGTPPREGNSDVVISWWLQGVVGTYKTRKAKVEIFTASGNWIKPAGGDFTTVRAMVMSGGGGGGSGRRGAAGTVRTGGAGGGGGGYAVQSWAIDAVAASVGVTVGAGGVGGAAVTTDDTNGNPGAAATTSSFGSYLRSLAGNFGIGGSTGAAAGGGGGGGTSTGTSGASSSGTGGGGSAATTNSVGLGATGGGSGGGITAANAASAGGAGGIQNIRPHAGGIAGAIGASGNAPATQSASGEPTGGAGGGGGGSSITAAAGDGGNGGNWGAGGGGGAASLNGNTSGKGGNGAPGIVVVTTT